MAQQDFDQPVEFNETLPNERVRSNDAPRGPQGEPNDEVAVKSKHAVEKNDHLFHLRVENLDIFETIDLNGSIMYVLEEQKIRIHLHAGQWLDLMPV